MQQPINGEMIMEIFGLKPSKPVGIIKDAIKDAILDGVIPNNYDEAYKFMLEKAREINIKPIKSESKIRSLGLSGPKSNPDLHRD